jgi:hypothetical protein
MTKLLLCHLVFIIFMVNTSVFFFFFFAIKASWGFVRCEVSHCLMDGHPINDDGK